MTSQTDLTPLFRAWLDSAMPQRQGMALGKVESATGDAQGYRCSVSLLEAETLEESGEKLEDVAILAVWAGGDGTGLWALPSVGQIVVIGFLAMDKSWPFVMGGYSQGLSGAAVGEGEWLLSQSNGASIKLDAAGLIALKNQNESLKGLLTALIDDLSRVKTIPAAPGLSLTLALDDIAKIQGYKARLAALLGD